MFLIQHGADYKGGSVGMINFEKMILEYSDKYADFAASTVALWKARSAKYAQKPSPRKSHRKKEPILKRG